MTEAEDLQAISETLRGNTDAFRVIVSHHGERMYRLAISFLHSPEEAEEATQEIFLRAFRSLRTFRIDKPLLPWLYAISMNYLRSRARRQSRFPVSPLPDEGRVPADQPQSDPQALVHAAEARAEVRRAVASLPSGVREAASLYYLEGMSVAQVAAALGIGEENVKSRLLRARRKLRLALDSGATP